MSLKPSFDEVTIVGDEVQVDGKSVPDDLLTVRHLIIGLTQNKRSEYRTVELQGIVEDWTVKFPIKDGSGCAEPDFVAGEHIIAFGVELHVHPLQARTWGESFILERK